MPTILIVDDDRHTRRLFEAIFREDARVARFEPRILQAGDGEEGLALAAEHHPDLVVTDLLMPRMDGFKFCEALRSSDHGRGVGLVVVSGVYRDPRIGRRVRDEWNGVFYTKPYQIKELVGTVEKLLATRLDPPNGRAATADPAPAAEAPAQNGDFVITPLPRLLLDLHEQRATGLLQLRRGRVEKRIDLVVGHPVAVTSNQRPETLGHFLVAKRLITEAQHQATLERARDEQEKFGEALIELGLITPGELVRQLTSQARFKITTALRWDDGAWSFRPNRDLLDRAKGNVLDPVAVVFLGLRRTANLEDAEHVVKGVGAGRIALSARGERCLPVIGRVFGAELVEAMREATATQEILAMFEPERALPALEATLLTRCLEVRFEGAGASPPPAETSGRAARRRALDHAQNLYDQLFGDDSSLVEALPGGPPPAVDLASDGVPIAIVAGDSSLMQMAQDGPDPLDLTGDAAVAARAREDLLEEYLRIQGKGWYEVLEVDPNADVADIDAALDKHMAAFSLDAYAGFDLGRDYAKLEEVHAVYRHAHDVLGDPASRQAYDRALGDRAPSPTQDSLKGELAFREGERALAGGDIDTAVKQFRASLVHSPDVADYHAALGWALHTRGTRGGEDSAHPPIHDSIESAAHLAQALTIDPDHPAGHEYAGRVLAAAGHDPETAIDHLEQALDARPPRLDALPPLEELRTERGEFAELDRRYRNLVGRIADREQQLRLWLSSATVCRTRLSDMQGARAALSAALKLAPDDPRVIDAHAELSAGDPARFDDWAEALRGRWRLDPTSPAPGLELFRAANAAARPDAAYLAAGALVARGAADAEASEYHRRFRPRFLLRAQQRLDSEVWTHLRHVDDDAEIGELFAVLHDIAAAAAPMTLADLDVGDADLIVDRDLPPGFAAVRDYSAWVLGVPAPRVYRRADFGHQVHVGAVQPPVLLAGPGALACEDRMEPEASARVELAFHVGRAMTYLMPGRAIGGSRPSRFLKAVLCAAMRLAVPSLAFDDADGSLARLEGLLADASASLKKQARTLALEVTRERTTVNLSRWASALARTADRVGLLLCGDVAVAARADGELAGIDALDNLVDFAVGKDHLAARRSLGLSIDV